MSNRPINLDNGSIVSLPEAIQNANVALRDGCYQIKFNPTNQPPAYIGTLRVSCREATKTASGDLYEYPDPAPDENAAPAMIFPLDSYRLYLRVTQMSQDGETIRLGFHVHTMVMSEQSSLGDGDYVAKLTANGERFEGGVVRQGGEDGADENLKIGQLTIRRVSDFLRRAVIEIDRVSGLNPIDDNGHQVAWASVFGEAGWDVRVIPGQIDGAVLANVWDKTIWPYDKLHQAMIEWREQKKKILDTEWHYYLIVVPCVGPNKQDGYPGVMFDCDAIDSDKIPREGAAVAAKWQIPNDEIWIIVEPDREGNHQPVLQDEARRYFRTAVHEIGHEMRLEHDQSDACYMRTTDSIVANSNDFPKSIQWRFSEADTNWLRHCPDNAVRPGGLAFPNTGIEDRSDTEHPAPEVERRARVPEYRGGVRTSPITDRLRRLGGVTPRMGDVTELKLEVTPSETMPPNTPVPWGAPVRVEIKLTNGGNLPRLVPSRLDSNSGFVKAKVIDESDELGMARLFSPLLLCLDWYPLKRLAAGESIHGSLTLMRGKSGWLFPKYPTTYRVVVQVEWHVREETFLLTGETRVQVARLPREDFATDEIYQNYLTTAMEIVGRTEPSADAAIVAAIGGENKYLQAGVTMIQKARQVRQLNPYFSYIDTKRMIQLLLRKGEGASQVAQSIDNSMVMSGTEVEELARLSAQIKQSHPEIARQVSQVFQFKLDQPSIHPDMRNRLSRIILR